MSNLILQFAVGIFIVGFLIGYFIGKKVADRGLRKHITNREWR